MLDDVLKIVRVATEPRRGVSPRYGPYHVIKLLQLLYQREPLGRHALSRELGLGEASTRTLLRRLREVGVVEIDRVGGAILTDVGRRAVQKLLSSIRSISRVTQILEKLRLDREAVAAIVDPSLLQSAKLVEIRDSIVRKGASAALILRIDSDGAKIPPDDIGEETFPELKKLREHLKAESGLFIVISYSTDPITAEKALIEGLLDIAEAQSKSASSRAQ